MTASLDIATALADSNGDGTLDSRESTSAARRATVRLLFAGDLAPYMGLVEDFFGDTTPLTESSREYTDIRAYRAMIVADFERAPRARPVTVPAFFAWMRREHRGPWAGAGVGRAAVTPGAAATVVPIGPEHPGWADWWAQLRRYAERDGYMSYYQRLATAMGGDGRPRAARIFIQVDGVPMQPGETPRQTAERYIAEHVPAGRTYAADEE